MIISDRTPFNRERKMAHMERKEMLLMLLRVLEFVCFIVTTAEVMGEISERVSIVFIHKIQNLQDAVKVTLPTHGLTFMHTRTHHINNCHHINNSEKELLKTFKYVMKKIWGK